MDKNKEKIDGAASASPALTLAVPVGQVHFERIAAISPDLIFIYDHSQKRNVYCNARVLDLLGYTCEEFQSPALHQNKSFIHPDHCNEFFGWMRHVLDSISDSVHQMEVRMQHADGNWRWFKLRASAYLRHADGHVLQMLGTGSDITDQVSSRESLQQQSNILQLILNSMTEGVMVCDTEGHLILVNRSAEQILQLEEPLSKLSQLKNVEINKPESGSVLQKWHQHPLMRSLEGETVADCELSLYLRKRGLSMTLSHASAPLLSADGKIMGAVDVFRDVTGSRQAIQELQRAEQHFRLLVDGTTDYAIFMLDKDGFIVSWNPGAERILGYRKQEILGRHISVFFTPEDQAKGEPIRKLKQIMLEGRSEEDSWRVRKDGQRFWCAGVMGALHDDAGKVQGFVEIMRDNTERRLAEQNTFFLANHDLLTGLPNRARFLERLHESLINADRDATRVAVILLDLDRFKSINDSLGHHAGDQLLQQVAQRLLQCIRETDIVARLGGDEFVVILTRLKSLTAAELLADNIIKEINRPCQIENHSINSGASLGVSMYPPDGKDAGELLQKADLAMYRAKSTGRNCYRVFSPSMLTEVQLRQEQEEQLRLALEQDEFELVYQPQIDVHTLEVIGVEALLRCRNQQLLMLSPHQIIVLAEDIGVIMELGEWVLRTGCEQISRWQAMNLPPFKLAVNFSPVQLMSPSIVDTIRNALLVAKIDAHLLEIEVTESSLVAASEGNTRIMHAIKDLGVSISVDDFGKGISTLSYLKDFPVDVLKLDATLIRNLPIDQEDVAIVSAILKLAHDLHIKVVAEGVETLEQFNYLRSTSCHIMQGFLFSEAVRPDNFELLLRNRKLESQFIH